MAGMTNVEREKALLFGEQQKEAGKKTFEEAAREDYKPLAAILDKLMNNEDALEINKLVIEDALLRLRGRSPQTFTQPLAENAVLHFALPLTRFYDANFNALLAHLVREYRRLTEDLISFQ